MSPVLAHGIGGIRDLPVPGWLFFYGASIVLVASFVLLGALWRRPLLDRAGSAPLPDGFQAVLRSRALRLLLGLASFGLLAIVFAAALAGEPDPARNVAPTFVYVIFWLGLVPVVVLFGNVWPHLNPWRAAADGTGWLAGRLGAPWEPPFEYPAGWGRWPAAALLVAWATLELAYPRAAEPRALAIAVFLYSALTWLGMAAFGSRTWLENGEAFSVYFGLLSRLSPFGSRSREVVARPPLAALAVGGWRPGTIAVVAVMLGSVAFDGVSRTTWWLERRYDVEVAAGAGSGAADAALTALNFVGLVLACALVALVYLGAVRAARSLGGEARASLPDAFIGSLVPIALAYAVAHYFSLLILQGQFLIPLASDPFGSGWDLFGTAGWQPDLTLLAPNVVWYVQVGVLVVGHVLGLVLAHDRAVALFDSPQRAVGSQYAMLALMVVYTVGGMYLLSVG